MNSRGFAGDAVAVYLRALDKKGYWPVHDVHILDNEFRNCNDAVQVMGFPKYGGGTKADYAGTIIDGNHMYVDKAVYTNGKGKHDPKGAWAWTENAIDLKAGSQNAKKPLVVSNNYMWGYRPTDTKGGGSGSNGSAMSLHNYVPNLVIRDNVMFNSNRGLVFGATHGTPASVDKALVHDNIFQGNRSHNAVILNSKNVTFERNTLVASAGSKLPWVVDNKKNRNLTLECNAVVNGGKMRSRPKSTKVRDNFFYNTKLDKQQRRDGKSYPKASDARLGDLVFTTDRLTNKPRKIRIPGVVTTKQSPHRKWCN